MWIFLLKCVLLVNCVDFALADSANVTCGPDEEYNSCANGGCGRWMCSQMGVGCYDLPEEACIPGCRCKEPMLRTDDGNCVPEDQCPSPKCGINEEYVECMDSVCRPLACAAMRSPLDCQQADNNQTSLCNNPGCVCKEGFVRDDINGTCIPTQQCLLNITCGAEEEFDSCATGDCGRTLCSENYTSCILPVDDSKCKPGCKCKDWKLKTDDGRCVPSHQCPQPSYVTCGPDEEYNSCSNGGCGRWLCSQLGIICIDLISAGCEPGCRCKSPLLRTDDGKCVPNDECPPPSCGVNEEFVKCENSICRPQYCYDLTRLSCDHDRDITCNYAACVCKEGFARNSRDGTCIPVEECSKEEKLFNILDAASEPQN
ncbi:protein psiQ-like [Aricia agestis]|uniref:protein psiQ-like n=1 Tax=Aricia agestis TaxID=91739 RepID=UPI001C20C105|nr:protein psiQ-like [Aricia agestis]